MEGINKERGRRKEWRWRKRGKRSFRKRRKNNLNSIEDSLLFVSDISIWYLISIRQPTDIYSESRINLQSICHWGDLEAHQGSLLYKVRRPHPILDLSSGLCWPSILWTAWGALLIGMPTVQWSSPSSSLYLKNRSMRAAFHYISSWTEISMAFSASSPPQMCRYYPITHTDFGRRKKDIVVKA